MSEELTTNEVNQEDIIYFHLPDYNQHFNLNLLFHDLMQFKPEYFRPNVKIGSVYGSFPGAIWNGGRTILGGFASREDIINCYKAFNDRGIAVRHTFTNSLIKGNMVYDTYCNIIMELGHNGVNEVLVNSPELEEYIREHFPNYPMISSTTKRIKSINKLKEEVNKGYKLVVLDYALNRSGEIYSLPNKEKYEILVDAYCCDDCPNRLKHYKSLAEDQLAFGHLDTENPPMGCEYIAEDFYDIMEKRNSFIKADEIYNFYYELGFRNFKIEGRTVNPFDVLESYVYYMGLPEYRDRIRLMMLKQMFAQPQQQQPVVIMSQEDINRLQEEGQIHQIK